METDMKFLTNIKGLTNKVLDLKPDEELAVRCADGEAYIITYKVIYDSSMYVFSHLGATSTSILLDEFDKIEEWLDSCTGGEFEYITDNCNGIGLVKAGWECMDPSTGQWAKKVDDFSWFYFERDNGSSEDAALIDIRDYTIKEIESAINAYGYTLAEDCGDNRSIHDLYGDKYLQIIAECIFESGI